MVKLTEGITKAAMNLMWSELVQISPRFLPPLPAKEKNRKKKTPRPSVGMTVVEIASVISSRLGGSV